MKKIFLTAGVALSLSTSAFGQWVNKTVNNGFDEPYNVTYTDNINEELYLKLEKMNNGDVALCIKGGYWCDEKVIVELAFVVNGELKKYSVLSRVGSSNELVIISFNIKDEDFFQDFLDSQSLKVRISDSVCTDDNYVISNIKMTGSTSAFNFINE